MISAGQAQAEVSAEIIKAAGVVYWLLPAQLKDILECTQQLGFDSRYVSAAISKLLFSGVVALSRDGLGRNCLVKTKDN